MMWLLAQFWVVALVALIAGFVITWLLVLRRIPVPERFLDRPQRVQADEYVAERRTSSS